MSPSLADNYVNVRKMHADYIVLERNASSLSTEESAEFEFDSGSSSELNDEPPLSPKLLYSHANYSPNVAIMAFRNQFSDIHASKADSVKQHQRPINRESHAANPAEEIKQRTNLSYLLNRRDLGQLSPLTNHQINCKDIKRQVRPVSRNSPASTSSSSSTSPSSSPINYRAYHYTDPCKFEDDHPESKICQKKGRKWAFKLDFFRKGPSPRADPAINQIAAGAAAGDARLNQQVDQSITSHHRAAVAAVAAREANFSNRINQRIGNYRVAAAEITEFESPRQSTCSVISSVSRSMAHADNETIRDDHRKISKSAPISPAGTPPRSPHGGEGAFTRGRAPMSPHALHYRQQRARNEELRRKTFLPYRQSLISACFFASAPKAHVHAPQPVY